MYVLYDARARIPKRIFAPHPHVMTHRSAKHFSFLCNSLAVIALKLCRLSTGSGKPLLRSDLEREDRHPPIPSHTKPPSVLHAFFLPNRTWFHTGSFALRWLRWLTFVEFCLMRIFACFPTHNAQEKSRTRLSSQFSSFIEKLSISLWSTATPLGFRNTDTWQT